MACTHNSTITLPGLLLETEWLSEHVNDAGLVILDTGRSADDYETGHIPEAVYLSESEYYGDVRGVPGMFLGEDIVADALRRAGVSNDSAVIIYDSGDGLWATRLFGTLELLGHGHVAILNGGYTKWAGEDLVVSTGGVTPKRGDFGPNVTPRLVVTGSELRDALDTTTVVDTRSRAEYDGSEMRAERGGHIPNAVHIEWVLNNTDGEPTTFLPVDTLRAFYRNRLGEHRGRIVTYCQTGVRGTHAYFVLRLLGYDTALYDASWVEWGNDYAFPVTVHTP